MIAKIFKTIFIANILILAKGFGNESESNSPNSSNDSSLSSAPDTSVAETIAQIANDPGAGFGGDR